MIAINKAEKDAVMAAFPNLHIVRTMKGKSKRHRYYCEENRQVMRFLDKLRGIKTDVQKDGGSYKNRKTSKRNSV